MKPSILLVGAGPMAIEHAKALQALGLSFDVVGRGVASSEKFTAALQVPVTPGGIEKFQQAGKLTGYSHAIVAVTEEDLALVCELLMNSGISELLIEKPAGVSSEEVNRLAVVAQKSRANAFVAYNRRFYASVRRLQEMVEEDGGVTSFHFEFTEWSHVIETLPTPMRVKNYWLVANSSHVIDLAFFLGGLPAEMQCYKAGHLDWHPSGSIYTGAGVSKSGALFSYHANWESAGRWGVEIMTRRHRLILKPLEGLQVQKRGSVAIEPVTIQDEWDKKIKPGVYQQMNAFFAGNRSSLNARKLLNIQDYSAMMQMYSQIRK